MWHLVQKCLQFKHEAQTLRSALWTPLSCPGNGVELCNSVTAFCVELHCDGKKVTYYFPYFKEKYFCL